MFVQGVVNLNRDGTAQLTLQPARCGQQAGGPQEAFVRRPTSKTILDQIRNGEILVHASRAQVSPKELTQMMNNIQRALRLLPGVDGQWNQSAWDRLRATLFKPREMRGRTAPLMALPAPAPAPALVDDGASKSNNDNISDDDSDKRSDSGKESDSGSDTQSDSDKESDSDSDKKSDNDCANDQNSGDAGSESQARSGQDVPADGADGGHADEMISMTEHLAKVG